MTSSPVCEGVADKSTATISDATSEQDEPLQYGKDAVEKVSGISGA